MKTKLLIAFFIAHIGLLKAQYTAIPGMVFEDHLIHLGIDSEGIADFRVLTSDIETVTNLHLRYIPDVIEPVFNITGIEDFTNLEYFSTNSCYFGYPQPIGNDGLIDFSNNLVLKSIKMFRNSGNSGISNLIIDQNINLEILICGVNSLESIDLSNNILLKEVELTANLLTALDVRNLNNLESLIVSQNLIDSLDLSQNSALSKIGCNYNNLNFLDLRNGNNKNIPNEYFIATNNPNLKCIYVDNAIYSTENWLRIDPTTTFVETEADCALLSSNEQQLALGVLIKPNPTTNFIEIETNIFFEFNQIVIYNLIGQEVLKTTSMNIDISNLEKGVYLLELIGNNYNITKKIIKI